MSILVIYLLSVTLLVSRTTSQNSSSMNSTLSPANSSSTIPQQPTPTASFAVTPTPVPTPYPINVTCDGAKANITLNISRISMHSIFWTDSKIESRTLYFRLSCGMFLPVTSSFPQVIRSSVVANSDKNLYGLTKRKSYIFTNALQQYTKFPTPDGKGEILRIVLAHDEDFDLEEEEIWTFSFGNNAFVTEVGPAVVQQYMKLTVRLTNVPIEDMGQADAVLFTTAGIMTSFAIASDPTAQTATVLGNLGCAHGVSKVVAENEGFLSRPIDIDMGFNRNFENLISVLLVMIILLVLYVVVMFFGERILTKHMPSYAMAAHHLSFPYFWVGAFQLFFQGFVYHAALLLMVADGYLTFGLLVNGVVVAFYVYVIVWHRQTEGAYEFRLYSTVPRFNGLLWRVLIFEGAWGPNYPLGRHMAFMYDLVPRTLPFGTVINMVICHLVALVVAAKPLGCLAQHVVIVLLLYGIAVYFLALRPLRWWFLNVFQSIFFFLSGYWYGDEHDNPFLG
eukprot:PhF_6_TR21211/c0_g1_i1/m.30630